MNARRPLTVWLIVPDPRACLEPLWKYWARLPHLHLDRQKAWPDGRPQADIVVTAGEAPGSAPLAHLEDYVQTGGAWLHLADPSSTSLPAVLGVRPGPVGPTGELRVRFPTPGHLLGIRLPDALYVAGRFQALEPVAPHTETLLYADWHHARQPVLVQHPAGRGQTACTTLQVFCNPHLQQIFHRLLGRLAGTLFPSWDLGVGLLGYPPWLGRHHGQGIQETPGLQLAAVCDLNAARREAARKAFPGVRTLEAAADLAANPDVDIVFVATSPDRHAPLAQNMMAAGKHVICEKPLTLTRRDAESLAEAAARLGVHLSCHQNRRWDPDFVAIREALVAGRIGVPFYLETFVGGFTHPCGYWHSHTPVSGGAAFDWGGHYLDWIVALMPGPLASVLGTRHKRVWYDVSNADQERVQIRFADGREAEFTHSDIAALRKPKWYLLGTAGAIVGHWRDLTAYDPDPVAYFQERHLPPTELAPTLTLSRRRSNGCLESTHLETPAYHPFGFHANLADHLILGEPLEAPLDDAVKVVTILEAAARSASRGGDLEVLNG
jgi:scyllo-inositol 2-dehydrogenase (NADP+)